MVATSNGSSRHISWRCSIVSKTSMGLEISAWILASLDMIGIPPGSPEVLRLDEVVEFPSRFDLRRTQLFLGIRADEIGAAQKHEAGARRRDEAPLEFS